MQKQYFRLRSFCLMGLFLLICSSALNAQLVLGAKADVAASWVPTPFARLGSSTLRPGFGPQFGGYARFWFYRKLFAETQLTFNQVSARYRFEYEFTDSNATPTGEVLVARTSFNISNLSVPLSVGIALGWCNIMLGAQANLSLASHQRNWSKGLPDYLGLEYDNKEKPLPIHRWDFGFNFGLTAPLTQRFFVEAAYYYGFNPIFRSGWWPGNGRVNQVTYGLRYEIWHDRKGNR